MGRATETEDKGVLNAALSELLGFDGTAEILDHLLSIESREDLLEYLSQLLGDDSSPKILNFVDNLGRFQRGDALSVTTPSRTTKVAEEQSEAKAETDKPVQTKPKASGLAASNKQTRSDANENSKETSQQPATGNIEKKVKQPSPTPASKPLTNKSPSTQMDNSTTTNSSKSEVSTEVQPERRQTKPPSRGTPKVVCGCFGTRHSPLTNCLFCGRISCVREGYDFCAFCGFQVEEVTRDGVHDNDKAWQQKERLLRFDRDFARRTQIIDDQADFQGTEWLSAEEEKKVKEQHEQQRLASRRPRQTLSINL